jgi:hypothetical protein
MAQTLPDWSARREIEFHSFDQALAEVDRLLTQPYERRGNWDLAQACDHLAYSFEGSVRGFDFGAPRIVQALIGQYALRYVLRNRRAPFRPRVPKRLEPPSGKDPHACVERLKNSILEFESHPGELARHPFFGKITREQWRQIHLFHCSHHLAFLHPSS